ncbi:hypothetical protein [Brevundimonas sp. FT23042]|uniref:hypothetical protein n=1 Tax=Brevundimonas sp. FT23042 TaxID=3393749 RepID=UPI003B586C3D
MTNRQTELYIVELKAPDGSERFHKIGISKNLDWRFSYGVTTPAPNAEISPIEKLRIAILAQHGRKPHPYKASVVFTVAFDDEAEALLAEREFLKVVSPARYEPQMYFSGFTECFQVDEEIVDALVENMRLLYRPR